MRTLGIALLLCSWPTAAFAADYLREVKHLLAERCYACHGALQQKGGLRLDTVKLLRTGGDRGPAVVPGKPAESLLLDHVTGRNGARRMPPPSDGEALKPAEVELLRAWIAEGASGPAEEQPEADPREHWAFRVPVRTVPAVRAGNNPIDAFLAVERQKRGLSTRPVAERRLLLRRVYLDLVGLPPTREETAAFLADSHADAYERVVDRLLASPAHGERWGRHWMDVWRYSDWWGLGAEVRNSQKHIWHWRDWILEAVSQDKGYDQMLREMLAADELYPTDRDRLRATGYLARGYFKFNRNTWLEEVVEHTSKSFLGLTMNCAKCHDHKYDPLAQEDFYRFRAFFEPYQIRTDLVGGETDFEKDGIPRAFDCNLATPTFLFIRGDERTPRKTRPLEPGLPALLAGKLAIRPVTLPAEAHTPGLRDEVVAAHLQEAQRKLGLAQAQLARARAELEGIAKVAVATPTESKPLVREDFATSQRWKLAEGTWSHQPGKLVQTAVGPSRAAARLDSAIPDAFVAKVRFTTRGGQMWKSVGLSFDVVDSNDVLVYLSAYAGGPKLQIAYKSGENYVYPPEAIRPRPVALGETQELTLRVRGRLVNVSVNGQHELAYELPQARKLGAIELVTFDAHAEFTQFELAALPTATVLHSAGSKATTPAGSADQARWAVLAAEKAVLAARLTEAGVQARHLADRARLDPTRGDAGALARQAARIERLAALAAAEEAAARAELQPMTQKRTQASAAVVAARKAVDSAGSAYTPLRGSLKTLESNLENETSRNRPFPTTSTGRRSALAAWMTDARNPLTARVAVNHVWARHMGRPLVATVFDLGRKGAKPTHPELLDWLAVELRESGWSLRHLHRLIVTSEAYQLASSSRDATAERARDPENQWYWRMNSRRMEAEVVRDSLLHLAEDLDPVLGGPPVPASNEGSRRRSLYYVHSHNDQVKFLEVFDHANVLECYRRAESIVPQQALALSNSRLAQQAAMKITARLQHEGSTDEAFLRAAFELILGNAPSPEELAECRQALSELTGTPEARRRVLVQALLNHNDFVTVR